MLSSSRAWGANAANGEIEISLFLFCREAHQGIRLAKGRISDKSASK